MSYLIYKNMLVFMTVIYSGHSFITPYSQTVTSDYLLDQPIEQQNKFRHSQLGQRRLTRVEENVLLKAKLNDFEDGKFDILQGEFGYNEFYTEFLEYARDWEMSIANRSKMSGYLAGVYISYDEMINSMFDHFNELLLKKNVRQLDPQFFNKHIFCLLSIYAVQQYFLDQMIVNPLFGGVKQSGLLSGDSSNYITKELRAIAQKYRPSLLINLDEKDEQLNRYFNKLLMFIIQDSDNLKFMVKSMEATKWITTFASFKSSKQKNEEKTDYILSKMIRTAEGIGLKAAYNLFFSEFLQLSKKIYEFASEEYTQITSKTNGYIKGLEDFVTWNEHLRLHLNEENRSPMTQIWVKNIEKFVALEQVRRMNVELNLTFDSNKKNINDKKVAILYSQNIDSNVIDSKNQDSIHLSHHGLKCMLRLTQPEQKIIVVDSPSQLSIAMARNSGGYIIFPDGNLEHYLSEQEDLKQVIDYGLYYGGWDIFGIGAGGLFLAEEIITEIGRDEKNKGLGLIPGVAGQASFVTGDNFHVNVKRPSRINKNIHILNKGRYIDVDEGFLDHPPLLEAKYSSDEDLGYAVLALKHNHKGSGKSSNIIFSGINIEAFFSYLNRLEMLNARTYQGSLSLDKQHFESNLFLNNENLLISGEHSIWTNKNFIASLKLWKQFFQISNPNELSLGKKIFSKKINFANLLNFILKLHHKE